MKLRMCNCGYCKHGRKRSYWRKQIRRLRSNHRSIVKRNLRVGEYDRLPIAIAVPYTD